MPNDITGLGQVATVTIQSIEHALSPFLKPAATEAGEWLADRIRVLRYCNIQNVLMKAKAKLDKANVDPLPISSKILFPLLEAAALEDENDMIDRWANLLATAASENGVLPSFVTILANLSPAEAQVLDWINKLQKEISKVKNPQVSVLAADLLDVRVASKLPQNHFRRIVFNLNRLGLIVRRFPDVTFQGTGVRIIKLEGALFGTTEFGDEFLAVCNSACAISSREPE
jgi:hypothetical protein